jgi:hypothetical protein
MESLARGSPLASWMESVELIAGLVTGLLISMSSDRDFESNANECPIEKLSDVVGRADKPRDVTGRPEDRE